MGACFGFCWNTNLYKDPSPYMFVNILNEHVIYITRYKFATWTFHSTPDLPIDRSFLKEPKKNQIFDPKLNRDFDCLKPKRKVSLD